MSNVIRKINFSLRVGTPRVPLVIVTQGNFSLVWFFSPLCSDVAALHPAVLEVKLDIKH